MTIDLAQLKTREQIEEQVRLDGVPDHISSGAVRRALIEDGLMPTVESAFNAIPSELNKRLLLADWEYEPRFHRTGRVILFLQTALGMTDRAVDDFFVSVGEQEGRP